MSNSIREATASQRDKAQPRLGLVLAVCCAAQFMVVLDASVVNVALPTISRSLHFSPDSLQWVINAYTIAFAGFLLLGGRLADLFGRRRVFLIGITVFAASSLVGGLSFNDTTLIAARAVQGLSAAIVAPGTLTVLTTTFTDKAQRARAFGMWGAVSGAGGAVGVLIGGVITQWLSWRWILLVNVPIGILLFAATAYAVTELRGKEDERRVDVAGAVSVTLGIMAFVYGIAEAQQYGWGSPRIVGALAVAVVLIAFFLVDQVRIARQPLVPLGILRNRFVSAANIVAFTGSAALFSTFYFFTLFTQQVLRYSPLETGLAYLPLSVGIFIGARGIAPRSARLGPRWILVAGLALSVAGLAWLSRASVDASFAADLLGPTLLLGLGQGMATAASANAATASLPYQQAGMASGLLNTNRQLGGAVGLAVLVALALARTASEEHAHAATRQALASGYGLAFLAAAVIAAAGIAGALAAPSRAQAEAAT
jgi:EmrB/QacA subfamily drug resistance transporter